MRRTRLGRRLAELRAAGKKGLIAYLCAGDPDPDSTVRLVEVLAAAGVDVVELGLPFSDPLADGPVIQAATERALAAGATTERVLAIVAALRRRGTDLPICLMTYANLIYRRGLQAFAAAAARAGVDGLIVPDLPLVEAADLRQAAGARGVALVPLIGPTTPPAVLAAVGQVADSFVYCAQVTGVTGRRADLAADAAAMVAGARRHITAPLALGFGISNAAQARGAARLADAVIVGSALVEQCGRGLPPADLDRALGRLAADLRQAVDAP